MLSLQKWTVAAVLLASLLAACSAVTEEGADYGNGAQAASAGGRHLGLEAYRLGPGDKVSVKVFNQPDLSGDFEIGSTGQLSIPLLGQIDAASRTVTELQHDLEQSLSKNFLVNPKVSVQVITYRPFFILGQVNKPGSYPFQAGINVRMAVAIAGGYTRRAREEPVTLYRVGGKGGEERLMVNQDAPVFPGDSIEVGRRLF